MRRLVLVLVMVVVIGLMGLRGGDNRADAYKVDSKSSKGITPLGSFQLGELGTVNLQNGNLVINLPLFSLGGSWAGYECWVGI